MSWGNRRPTIYHIQNHEERSARLELLEENYAITNATVLRIARHPEFLAVRATRESAYAAWKSVHVRGDTTTTYQCAEYPLYKEAEQAQLNKITELAKSECGIDISGSVEHQQYLRNAVLDCHRISALGLN